MLCRSLRLALLLLLFAGPPAAANTIAVVGTPGTNGASGAPGQPGGNAGEGGDANATAQANDPLDSATATGGRGGGGGRGGDGLAGQVGGSGGAGGNGGDATATATTARASDAATAQANATGGAGGLGGLGGRIGAGTSAGPVGPRGSGGAASASACAVSQTGTATASARATGGAGGASPTGGAPGAGGAASTQMCAETFGAGQASSAYDFNVRATGGAGSEATGAAGRGGDATQSATATAHGAGASAYAGSAATGGAGGNSTLATGGRGGDASAHGVATGDGSAFASEGAQGGQGGSGVSGGDGGDAFAEATAISPGTAFVTTGAEANAFASGGIGGAAFGPGGRGGDGGSASGRAEARSIQRQAFGSIVAEGGRGGVGNDEADGGDGGDAFLDSAVSGSSPVYFELTQAARGGEGGSATSFSGPTGIGGRGGDATSIGEFVASDGSLLQVNLSAIAGLGGFGATSRSASGTARVGGTLTGARDQFAGLYASARTGAGGTLQIDPLLSIALGTGRAVTSLSATQGAGLDGDVGGAGGSLSLVNRVEGRADLLGEIFLSQSAVAGDGGRGFAGAGGAGGDAESILDVTASVQRLWLTGNATGGRGGSAAVGSPGTGGVGSVALRGRNDAGAVELHADAFGGTSGFDGPRGGDGTAVLEATTLGDGHDILVIGAAEAGRGSGIGGPGAASVSADGGALGDSRVQVFGRAFGGFFVNGPPAGADGSDGATASADVRGSNAGSAAVEVFASASGGAGASASTAGARSGDGGSATARAHGASTTGAVNVTVEQSGGAGGGFIQSNDPQELGGDGASSLLDNAATGSTDGDLSLRQLADGGNGGNGQVGGAGGDARSVLEVTHAGSGNLTLDVEALGGEGGRGLTSHGTPGASSILAVGGGSADVSIRGSVTGAGSFPGGAPGEALIERLYGESTGGGDVSVSGTVRGAYASTLSDAIPASALLDNAVDGATTGSLHLEQHAFGGGGYSADSGSATSRLTRTFAGESLTAVSEAVGGQSLGSGQGGGATSFVDVVNLSGDASAQASAIAAGSSFNTVPPSGAPGAQLEARATSFGDGHAVTVGGTYISPLGWGAFGPEATSLSVGVAQGDSVVSVSDRARGGNAVSRAEGSNQGASAVTVSAEAAGGTGEQAGTATASAFGSSLSGDVTVTAMEQPGRPFADIAGADRGMIDAVAGSTAGRLTLKQTTSAGSAGLGDGGDALSSLETTNARGGTLEATAEATGGSGGRGDGDRGGDAAVHVAAETRGSVRVTGRATGGAGGGSTGRGGDATLDSLFGRSTEGGDVAVFGFATGGSGSIGSSTEGGRAGDAILVNAVDGETTGNLTLEQRARGGETGTQFTSSGQAGNATSLLEREVDAAHVTLRSYATTDFFAPRDAGSATASGLVHNHTGGAIVDVLGDAGNAGSAQGAGASALGGDASAIARGVSEGDGHDIDVSARAFAGRGGGVSGAAAGDGPESVVGGDATSEATGIAGDAAVAVSAVAAAGAGGSIAGSGSESLGGRGGNASAIVHGENGGSQAVSVIAYATASWGGNSTNAPGAQGGEVFARGYGRSSGGGDVSVEVTQIAGDGGDAFGSGLGGTGSESLLADAATGETSGALRLTQIAWGGEGGRTATGSGGASGRAESVLRAENPGGGAIEAIAESHGGSGGDGSTLGADGAEGFASVIATGHGAEAVTAHASASGGFGGRGSVRGGAAGSGRLGTVFASSDGGGDVTAIGEITTGQAGGFGATVGAVVDSILIDAVDGSTSGALTLRQRAAVYEDAIDRPDLVGRAESQLHRAGTFEQLTLGSAAFGREALALAEGTNLGGGIGIDVVAQGVDGEAARSEARATSMLDGAAVRIGGAPPQPYAPSYGAHGGRAGETRGGDAESLSVGTHGGDGLVTVYDLAVGGSAYYEGPRDGGDALSTALASNAGDSRVEAHAHATGGNSVFLFSAPPGIVGGEARATASAHGLGDAFAEAIAEGGAGDTDGRGLARADASGASAEARAVAAWLGPAPAQSPLTPRYTEFEVSSVARASDGSAVAEATQASGVIHPEAESASPDAFAHAARALTSETLAAALAGNAAATAAFGRNAEEVLALVETGGGSGERDIVLGSEVSIIAPVLDVSGEDLLIGFLDPALSGLKSLRLRITLGTTTAFEIAFTDGGEAEDFFDDAVLAFDIVQGQALSIFLDMETQAGAPRAMLDFLVATAVPEPRVLALLLLAALALARRARAPRVSAPVQQRHSP